MLSRITCTTTIHFEAAINDIPAFTINAAPVVVKPGRNLTYPERNLELARVGSHLPERTTFDYVKPLHLHDDNPFSKQRSTIFPRLPLTPRQ